METKKIMLQHMEIHQFKGIQHLSIDFMPEKNSLYGANASGKTTVYDALIWLLFDKDSSGNSKFSVKPVGAEQGVTPTVSANFLVDGQSLSLKKILREKWEKHRGGEARFSGDTREYFVDDVPRKETEYKKIVSSYIEEKQFKLLTNLYAFTRDMHWKDRRALLGELCHLPSDLEIASDAPKFAPLLEILKTRPAEDYKTMLITQRKGINTKLNTLPVRIDECERLTEQLKNLPFEQAKKDIAALQVNLQQEQTALAGLDGDAFLSQVRNEKRSLEMDLQALEMKNQQHRATQTVPTANPREALKKEFKQVHDSLCIANEVIKNTKQEIQDAEKRLEEYRARWKKIQKQTVTVDTVCPTCGQPLPAEKIQAVQKQFAEEKSTRLQELVQDSGIIKQKIKEITADLEQTEQLKDSLQQQGDELCEKMEAMPEYKPPVVQDLPEYEAEKSALLAKIAEKSETVSRLQTDKQAERDTIQRTIAGLQEKIQEAQAILGKEQQLKDTKNRITELQQERRQTAQKLEEIDSGIDLCEEFAQYKANLTEKEINSHFRIARFQMFRRLVNGGLEDCCEITVNGVPYSDLNNAMKVNVGLDCIATLSDYFKVHVPLFVDNAESVTALLEIPSQLIRLIVSEQDKTLRIA